MARGALYVVSLGALVVGVQAVVQNPMTAALIGAVAVSFAAGRAGIESESATAAAFGRGARAGAIGLAAAAVAALVALALDGHVELVAPGATFAFSLAEAGAVAYRDEIWLHGIPLLFGRRGGLPAAARVGFAVAASVAVIALAPGADPAALLLRAASATVFALLWLRTGDAWAPVGAHFAWAWTSEALLNGELFDLASPAGRIARDLGASGTVAWVAAACFAIAAVLLARGVLPIGSAPAPGGSEA